MCGTLFGTLPQAQQQNVFNGLPLELMKEEVKLLVEAGAGVIVDDHATHRDAAIMLSEDDKAEILALKEEEQIKLAQANYEESMRKKEIAIQNAKSSGKWKTKPPKPVKTHESSLLEEDAEQSLKQVVDSSQPPAEELGNRQYIIPMATPSIGQYSLGETEPSLPVPESSSSRYEVYKFLQGQGYFLSPGLRFGCQFLAYPGDPLRFHSHFLVKCLGEDEEISILDLVGGGRLGTGVKKAWMIAGATRPSDGGEGGGEDETKASEMRAFCVEWGGFG